VYVSTLADHRWILVLSVNNFPMTFLTSLGKTMRSLSCFDNISFVILVGLNFPKKLYIKPTTYICYERERSRINRLERQDEMRDHEQDAR
jgi:hypothetical protein